MLFLSGFELYSRWVPLVLIFKFINPCLTFGTCCVICTFSSHFGKFCDTVAAVMQQITFTFGNCTDFQAFFPMQLFSVFTQVAVVKRILLVYFLSVLHRATVAQEVSLPMFLIPPMSL